jgi:hypothetical protein
VCFPAQLRGGFRSQIRILDRQLQGRRCTGPGIKVENRMRLSLATALGGLAPLGAMIMVLPAGALGQAAPSFKSGSLLSEGNTHYEMSVSSDKNAATVIFDGLENQLDGQTAPLFATRVFSISMPLTGAEKGIKLGVFLEGAVFRLKGTDISLITTVNGQTHVMDFAKFSTGDLGSEACAKFWPAQEQDSVKRKTRAKYSAPKKPDIVSKQTLKAENDSSFVQCILLDAASASALRINVVLAVNRHNRDTAGYLNVTSINASVQAEAKRAK